MLHWNLTTTFSNANIKENINKIIIKKISFVSVHDYIFSNTYIADVAVISTGVYMAGAYASSGHDGYIEF